MGRAQDFFWTHIEEETDACILWPLATRRGYGTVKHCGLNWFTHRLACEIEYGACPVGMETAHRCGNRLCFNRRHVRWATRVQNAHDKETTDADLVRLWYAGGHSITGIAQTTGRSRQAVSRIVNNHTWKL